MPHALSERVTALRNRRADPAFPEMMLICHERIAEGEGRFVTLGALKRSRPAQGASPTRCGNFISRGHSISASPPAYNARREPERAHCVAC